MTKFKELLQKYYLFSANNSSFWLVFLVSFCAGVTLCILVCFLDIVGLFIYNPLCLISILSVSLLLSVANVWFVKAGIKKYISLPISLWQLKAKKSLSRDEDAYEIIVFADGKVSYIEEPMLGKGKIYLVKLRLDKNQDLANSSLGKFSLSFNYTRRIKLENCVLVVRFDIRVFFKDDPTAQELYEKLIKHSKESINEFLLNDFLLEEFISANNFSEEQIEVMVFLANKLISDEISKHFLISYIKRLVVFPKRSLNSISGYSFVEGSEDVLIDT